MVANRSPCLIPGCPPPVMDGFHLQGMEETLHGSAGADRPASRRDPGARRRGVVVAAGRASHRRDRLHAGELLAVGIGGVLAAAVAVMNETPRRSSPLHCHYEG